ncbi:catalase family protein (plasmid) [Novosphingobium sp. BL-8A]|uniref:catalase family protein n=1 Tax=Novosphingobium sp. BL-8A TaxID=3127639 RepID=UPI0037581573
MTGAPVPYSPEVETIEPGEQAVQQELAETFRKIIETTYADSGLALRGVHAKNHALLQCELDVIDGLPAELAQGVFGSPRTYPVLIRISAGAGDILPDSISLLRGIGIKLIGVEGDRLAGSEGASTQDFLLASGKAFPSSDPRKFLANLKLLAATTDKVEGLKKAVSAVFRTVEKGVNAMGGESQTLEQLGGHPNTHPLGESFFSQAPVRYGAYIAKLSLVPRSATFKALEGKDVDIAGRPDALREEIAQTLAAAGGEWELRVQLCRDLATDPIEDASAQWPEEENPYPPVAVLRVPSQPSWTLRRARMLDEEMSFNPWHGIEEHRPLGAVMRARKVAYAASVDLRSRLNGCPIHEPATTDLPA